LPWLLWGLTCCTAHAPADKAPVERVRTDLARSSQSLRKQARTDGITQLKVESGFRHATIVVRAPDGSRRARCTDQPEQAARMLLEGAE
jgi:hypothetical protein